MLPAMCGCFQELAIDNDIGLERGAIEQVIKHRLDLRGSNLVGEHVLRGPLRLYPRSVSKASYYELRGG